MARGWRCDWRPAHSARGSIRFQRLHRISAGDNRRSIVEAGAGSRRRCAISPSRHRCAGGARGRPVDRHRHDVCVRRPAAARPPGPHQRVNWIRPPPGAGSLRHPSGRICRFHDATRALWADYSGDVAPQLGPAGLEPCDPPGARFLRGAQGGHRPGCDTPRTDRRRHDSRRPAAGSAHPRRTSRLLRAQRPGRRCLRRAAALRWGLEHGCHRVGRWGRCLLCTTATAVDVLRDRSCRGSSRARPRNVHLPT